MVWEGGREHIWGIEVVGRAGRGWAQSVRGGYGVLGVVRVVDMRLGGAGLLVVSSRREEFGVWSQFILGAVGVGRFWVFGVAGDGGISGGSVVLARDCGSVVMEGDSEPDCGGGGWWGRWWWAGAGSGPRLGVKGGS